MMDLNVGQENCGALWGNDCVAEASKTGQQVRPKRVKAERKKVVKGSTVFRADVVKGENVCSRQEYNPSTRCIWCCVFIVDVPASAGETSPWRVGSLSKWTRCPTH